mgnify:CR=1 FL=1
MEECHQIPLRYGVPFLLHKLEELSKVYCWRMVVMNTAAQDVPEVLIGAISGERAGQFILVT